MSRPASSRKEGKKMGDDTQQPGRGGRVQVVVRVLALQPFPSILVGWGRQGGREAGRQYSFLPDKYGSFPPLEKKERREERKRRSSFSLWVGEQNNTLVRFVLVYNLCHTM